MAEKTQFYLENTLPELECLIKSELFTREEIAQVVKARTKFEFGLHSGKPTKKDFIDYIQYECTLESMRRLRKQRQIQQNEANGIVFVPKHSGKKRQKGQKGQKGNMVVSDYSILSRIHSLYQKALKKFHGDIELWLVYFQWASESGSTKQLNKMFAKAIQYHPTKPDFWILNARYLYETTGGMKQPRTLFYQAIRLIGSCSPMIWSQFFALECEQLIMTEKREAILSEGGMSVAEKQKGKDACFIIFLNSAKELQRIQWLQQCYESLWQEVGKFHDLFFGSDVLEMCQYANKYTKQIIDKRASFFEKEELIEQLLFFISVDAWFMAYLNHVKLIDQLKASSECFEYMLDLVKEERRSGLLHKYENALTDLMVTHPENEDLIREMINNVKSHPKF